MRGWPGLLVAAALLAPLAPASAVRPEPRPSAPTVLHRVVWDEYQRSGTHLWSANPDGSDRRRIYVRRTGFVNNITLNRAGTQVAVAPVVLSADRAALVVVDVLGRSRPRDLLADHPEVRAVGGVGWSPDGRHVVFEGAIGDPDDLEAALFTVRRDGGSLRRVASIGPIGDVADIVLHTSLAWTPAGIFYYDDSGLHRFRAGESPVVLRGVVGEAISGDGSWLYVERRHGGEYAMWRMHPDGSGLERLYPFNYPGYGYESAPDEGYTYYSQPSYDGTQMLAQLDGPAGALVLAHQATRAPLATDPALPFSSIGAISWN